MPPICMNIHALWSIQTQEHNEQIKIDSVRLNFSAFVTRPGLLFA